MTPNTASATSCVAPSAMAYRAMASRSRSLVASATTTRRQIASASASITNSAAMRDACRPHSGFLPELAGDFGRRPFHFIRSLLSERRGVRKDLVPERPAATRHDERGKLVEHAVQNVADGVEGLQPFNASARLRDEIGFGIASRHVDQHDRGALPCVTNLVSGATE